MGPLCFVEKGSVVEGGAVVVVLSLVAWLWVGSGPRVSAYWFKGHSGVVCPWCVYGVAVPLVVGGVLGLLGQGVLSPIDSRLQGAWSEVVTPSFVDRGGGWGSLVEFR